MMSIRQDGEALKSNRELREVILTLKEQILAIYNRCLQSAIIGGLILGLGDEYAV
jgi:hypothetical protein